MARRLAEYYGVDHSFLATDPGDEPPRVLIDRFLVAGEGRTDQIAGYLDGLAIWKTLFDEGVTGVIRGDEPGWGEDACFSAVRRSTRQPHRGDLRLPVGAPHPAAGTRTAAAAGMGRAAAR